MKKTKEEQPSTASGRKRFEGFNILLLVSSAFYWAWFDTAVFRPTLFLPFSGPEVFYKIHLVTALTSGAVILLLATLNKEKAAKILELRSFGLTAITIALSGSLITMLGSSLTNTPLVFIGAVFNGTTCSFFLLEWARIYSRKGVKSAGPLIASAIAFGILIDTMIFALNPLFAAFFSALLPVVTIAFLLSAYNTAGPLTYAESTKSANSRNKTIRSLDDSQERETNNESTLTPVQSQHDLSLSDIFSSSHFRFFGLSLSLVAAFFIFGFSFGYTQFTSAFASSGVYPLSSDALLISRGITALAIFLAIYFFPRHIYAVFRIGILVGIAGFIAVPIISTLTNSDLISGFVVAIGYTTFDIITWTLLAELAFATNTNTVETFGPGRFVVHISIVIGFLTAQLLLTFTHMPELMKISSITIGYFLVIAEILLLSENSALWMLIRTNVTDSITEDALSTQEDCAIAHNPKNLNWVTESFGLTDRETEILAYLLTGRSRPRIAQILFISENTVSSHIRHIYHKLGVHGFQELLDRFS